MRLLALVLLLSGLAASTRAASAQDASRLATFVDCQGFVPGCDQDFFQTEIGFAQFVRDPAVASVYVLIVDEDTGGGGNRYTLLFEGRRAALRGRRDTLVTSTPPGASDDDQRRALLGRLSLGLAGFASRTGLAGRLTVGYDAPTTEQAVAEEVSDPWNSWVFRLSGSGFFNGQAQSQSANMFGQFSASRVTEAFKVSVRPRAGYNRSSFELSDGSTFTTDNANYGLNAGAVWSLSPHWSAGARAELNRNTFSNIDGSAEVGPAVEYNIYPYSEATQRQLRVFYTAGVRAVAYQDSTVLLETSEVLGQHQLGLAAEFAQPWGSVDVFSSASQFLGADRFDKYNLRVGGGVDLRLLQGLSLRLNGQYQFVRDQIGLRAQRATDGEILTGQFELATGYDYFASVGISYTFGSIFNQVVNPRLD